ncbi:replication protein C, IncQ-type [Marinomonas ostreistagni]|uniref:replication protein C, IncQ-type n=1 Tax=Marinomonas ostreistagni TaxID=359209 RepID=UPI0019513B0B|nr:replication protein C, IncQ-type [Marinomonas ostreistagni]MBM6552364.1 replication protein C [Marinomonas ostreistagni]
MVDRVKKLRHQLTHVRHAPSHCLAPGLFRALQKGERKKSKLDVVYDYGKGRLIEFSGPEPLGADDLRVLQGLIAMAGPTGLLLKPEPATESGQQLRLFLEPKWEAVDLDAMVVKCSYRNLAQEIGYATTSNNTKTIKDCIERMWKVSIIVQHGGKRKGFRLLAEYESDDSAKNLYVALNPMIAEAILPDGQHVRIDMDEVRALRTHNALLIHQRLCAWINPGQRGKVALETLSGYLHQNPATGATLRKRHSRLRDTLSEIQSIGWLIVEYRQGMFEIQRP